MKLPVCPEFRKAFMFFKKSELAKELNFQVIIFSVTPTLPGYLRLLLCILSFIFTRLRANS